MLTQEELKSMLMYEPETGVFTWIVKPNRRVQVGQIASNQRRDGYVRIGVGGTRYLAHRLAWLYVYGEWPAGVIDHVNGDPSDNRIANLRDCSMTENQMNRGIGANNTSGRKGVIWDKSKQKWLAKAQLRRQTHYLGHFDDLDSAHAAYQRFVSTHHGEFAPSKERA